MVTRPTDGPAPRNGVPRLPRFVLVNARIPRADACCAMCTARIEDGYVRDPGTRLFYCGMSCFAAHEKMSLPVSTQPTRRVS